MPTDLEDLPLSNVYYVCTVLAPFGLGDWDA